MILSPQGENDLEYSLRPVSSQLEATRPQFWGVKVKKVYIGAQNFAKIHFLRKFAPFQCKVAGGGVGGGAPHMDTTKERFKKRESMSLSDPTKKLALRVCLVGEKPEVIF